ncbi:TonB-linked SusC/RagA family outer membrane protein [Dyadobacter jejuensis]|uniref:TonB-linked SusC/RagA family outer membrane protein n=1 Tax=Dyadobacter jejuensis TaxID=1082580 RepID=A0A316AQT9_9BACT|nr:TonB-dependent receptor [Dyadobacter jejuensis]PWJ59574.1 TonB-linked SusC/RagA family outer membrane protein [Dyadobacter jejuensis]
MRTTLLFQNRNTSILLALLLWLGGSTVVFAKNSDLFSPKRQVTGTVVDNAGELLPGVSVVLKGSSQGTTTNSEGKFTLEVPDNNTILVFSFVGYQSKEVTVGNQSQLQVELTIEDQVLNEVVVVGYGTQQKVNLTGAVGVADAKRLENRPIANAGEGLQGVIPNLNVGVRNGDPSQATTFNIRGYESINGGSPLILVDNVPMDINLINPNDIESISVLKDASASAVYGARAAFGVVLVTTKSGKSGKVKVNFGTQLSMAKPIFNMDVVTDPYEFVQAWNTANERTFGNPAYGPDFVAATKKYSENPIPANEWGVVDGALQYYGYNNYQKSIMTDYAPTNQQDLSISGGGANSKYFFSLGRYSKDGYLRQNNEKFKRYNVLMKADFKVNDWLSFDEKVIFNSQHSDKPHFYNWDVNINSLARVKPIMPVQFPDLPFYIEPGDRDQYEQYIGKYFGGTNFFPYLLDGGRETFTKNDIWLTQGVTLTPIEGLKITGNFSYNLFNNMYQDVQSKVEIVDTDLNAANPISNGFSGDDWIENSDTYNQYYVLNAFAEYRFQNLGRHNLTAMVGFNQERGKNRSVYAQARSLITPQVTDLNATTGVQRTDGSKSHVALRGAFYRLTYNYDDRYLVEFNGRYDGTSRFPQDSRFGFFPSVSAGWRISNEKFMAGTINWLDNLKIRASYGTLGNQLLGSNYYPYVASLGTGQSPYMFSNSVIPYVSAAGLVSPTLTWESVTSQNIGLDLTLLKSRLDLSFDLYSRDTKDMLMNVNFPDILGTDAPKSNAADLRTKGWELALTWRDKIKSDWSYDVTLALSDATAQITKFENPSGALPNASQGIYYIGQNLGEIWGYETVGIFQSQDEVDQAPDQSRLGNNWRPGDIQYADLNGDGQISPGGNTLGDPGDRKVIGNSTPRYSFGINTSIAYKNFRLTAFFQGIGKADYSHGNGNWNWFFPFNAGHVENYYIKDSWSEDNRDAYFPAPHISTSDKKNIQTQSRFLQNASYIRAKNITLNYDIPQGVLERIGLSRAQIFVSGMNLFEFSKIRKPLDPETIQTPTIEYPMQRIGTLGINLSF